MDASGKPSFEKQPKVGVFTPRSIEPLHPRLVFFRQYFQSRNSVVEFINASDYGNTALSRINWLSLWYFDLLAIRRCRKRLKDFDIIMVTDLKYLPLVKYAKRLGKTVIYDTIDHNVYLRFYQLQRKIPSILFLKDLIISYFTRRERLYAFRYCDVVLVNSEALHEYFDRKSFVVFYSSPFENISVKNEPALEPAFLYLGVLTNEKGAHDILELQQTLELPLYIFGPVEDPALVTQMSQAQNVFYSPKISVFELGQRLADLFGKHFFFGFSLIKPAHVSYEVQEANKDIDYLALGVPLIGNMRTPTRTKIEAGCGVYVDDPLLGKKIFDMTLRGKWAESAKAYYAEMYHTDHAIDTLDGIFSKLKK
jgi:glycosyltransferase involved in cell wall biosynthesis